MDKADRINRKYEARKMREEQKERKRQRKKQSEIAKWDMREKRASDRYRTLSDEALDYYCERVRRRIRRWSLAAFLALVFLSILGICLTLALDIPLSTISGIPCSAVLIGCIFAGIAYSALFFLAGGPCDLLRDYCLCFIEQNQRMARRRGKTMNYKKSAEKIVKDYDRYMKRRAKADEREAARKALQEVQLETQFRDVSDEVLQYAVQKWERKMDISCLIFVVCSCAAVVLFSLFSILISCDIHIPPICTRITILVGIIGIIGFALLCIIGLSPAELELERRRKNRLKSKNETSSS